MHSLAQARRSKRYQSGALSLNTPKLSFKLDDNGNPAAFGSYPIRDSNRLVEVGLCTEFNFICLMSHVPLFVGKITVFVHLRCSSSDAHASIKSNASVCRVGLHLPG